MSQWGSYPGSNYVVIRGVVALVGSYYIFKWKLGLVAHHKLVKRERENRGGGLYENIKNIENVCVCVCVCVCACVYVCVCVCLCVCV